MQGAEWANGGSGDAPILPDYYDRAVFRRPPPCFSVETLFPIKHGGNVGYRMLISSIHPDTASCLSSVSCSSYEIWRRWSDCLMFQDTLEVEYARMARSKKRRLVAGKGIKKNGVYIHDRASSFESLPNGPDPSSVHLNIHHYLPKLTKKSTLFGASQATVNQRHKEVEALIQNLFSPDAPTLLHELRQVPSVTEFFGFWRRDHDRTIDLKRAAAVKCNKSASNSILSFYFSPVIGEDSLSSPEPQPPSRSLSRSSSLSSLVLSSIKDGSSRSRPESVSSKSSSDASSRYSGGSYRTSNVISQESSIIYSNKPTPASDGHREGGRAVPVLGTLPESVESELAIKFANTDLSPTRRTHKAPVGPRANSRGQTSTTSPISQTKSPGDVSTNGKDSVHTPDLTNHISMVSANDYLEQLQMLTRKPDEDQSSRNSVATSRTTCSADATIPRLPLFIKPTQPLCDSPTNLTSIPEVVDDDLVDPDSSILTTDGGLSPHTRSPSDTSWGDDFMHNSMRVSDLFRPRSSSTTSSSSPTSSSPSIFDRTSLTQDEARSFTESVLSSVISSSPTSPAGTLTIKAALDDSIVVFRVPRTISLEEIRRRLYNKFVGQEGAPLSESFPFAQIITTTNSPIKSIFARRRLRSNSISAAGASGSIMMMQITSQQEWEEAIRGITSPEKLTLHISRNSS